MKSTPSPTTRSVKCKHCGTRIFKTSSGIWRHGALSGWSSCNSHEAGTHVGNGPYATPDTEAEIITKILIKYES